MRFSLSSPGAANALKGWLAMIMWISANWINLLLIAVIALIIGLLIRSMIRDRKAGKSPCGGNCACCGACTGCSACSSKCATGKPIAKT